MSRTEKPLHPAYLPIKPWPEWCLVGADGSFRKDCGCTLRFATESDALTYMKANNIPLLPPRE